MGEHPYPWMLLHIQDAASRHRRSKQRRRFELLGATPKRMDLTEAIEGIVDGSLDAQENPFANTVTYGAHKYHRYHTLSNHFYISRSIMCHRDTYESWPEDIQTAMQEAVRDAIIWQRGQAEQEAIESRQAIEDEGCEIVELTPEEHAEFVQAVKPQHDEARQVFGDKMFELLENS